MKNVYNVGRVIVRTLRVRLAGFALSKNFVARDYVMRYREWIQSTIALWLCVAFAGWSIAADEDADVAEVRKSSAQLADAFNSGKAEAVTGLFLPKGEIIDENGTVYQGSAEISELLKAFFAKFPEVNIKFEIESIRIAGPVAIEEGTRTITAKDQPDPAQVRYVAVRAKTDDGWKLASIRDFSNEPAPTPHDLLEPLAWLVGDWVNEGTDAVVKISFKWSEDKNYLLGDYLVTKDGQTVMKSSQRIGWDPVQSKVRSWFFDSDGGFAEGVWTPIDGAWVIKSAAVLPQGETGSATVTITPQDNNRFMMAGTDRIAGNERQADFEVTVAKQAPSPRK